MIKRKKSFGKSGDTKRNKKENQMARVLRGMHFGEYVDFIRSPWRTFFYGFLKGTGMGLGLLVGTAIVMYLILHIISILGGVPFVGEWLEGVGKFLQEVG